MTDQPKPKKVNDDCPRCGGSGLVQNMNPIVRSMYMQCPECDGFGARPETPPAALDGEGEG